MNRSLWQWLIVAGVLLVILGILCAFTLDHVMLKHRIPFAWGQELNDLPLPTLILGLALSIIGAVGWAKATSLPRLAIAGLTIITGFAALAEFFPFNVHDWSAYLYFVTVAAFILGTGLLLIAGVRSLVSAKKRA